MPDVGPECADSTQDPVLSSVLRTNYKWLTKVGTQFS